MTKVEVDSKQVLNMFTELSSRDQVKVYRTALKSGANILAKETRTKLKSSIPAAKSKNWWNGKTMVSGIKVTTKKDGSEAKVHLMGDFRLKYFEMGTSIRKTTGNSNKLVRGRKPLYRQRKATNRGSISARWFFKNAKAAKETEIFGNMDNLISKSIVRISNKYKK